MQRLSKHTEKLDCAIMAEVNGVEYTQVGGSGGHLDLESLIGDDIV